jgi:hypothetical protein
MKKALLSCLMSVICSVSYGQVCFNGQCSVIQKNVVAQNKFVPNRVFVNNVCDNVVFDQHVVKQQVLQAVPVIQAQREISVINNLIGIPVPVTYDSSISKQGSTIYGYSSVAEAHGTVDLGLLYNQASRLAEQAQQLAGQAHVDFTRLVEIEGSNRAEVAKIIAQGQAAREVLSAINMNSSSNTQNKNFAFKITTTENSTVGNKVDSEKFNISSGGTDYETVVQSKCVVCHNSGNAQGALNLEERISREQRESILERVITDDPIKRMPRNADGSASPRLSVNELKALFNSMPN